MDYTNYLSSTKSDNFPLRGKVGQLSKKKRVLCWSNYIISLWFGDTATLRGHYLTFSTFVPSCLQSQSWHCGDQQREKNHRKHPSAVLKI